MRKKKLIEQNLSLFEDLQKAKNELNNLKLELNRSVDVINCLKAQLEQKVEQQETPVIVNEPSTPLQRLEEKLISNASLKPDVEYGAKIIGELVVVAADYSNKLTVGGDDTKKELINLILGKTEVAKAEILTVIESDDSLDTKFKKIDQIALVTKEYYDSVFAQLL